MKFRVLLTAILFLLIAMPFAFCQDAVYAPLNVSAKIKAVETTKLDIGDPKALFDLDTKTLIRTPAINPAYVLVEFTEPITLDVIKIQLIETSHNISFGFADNIDDLRSKSGSYKQIGSDIKTTDGIVNINFDKRQTIRALRLDVKRTVGDDYVHISEIEFCVPGKVNTLNISRIVDRRNSDKAPGLVPVEGIITAPESTVIWLKAYALIGESNINIADKVEWKINGDGITPWGKANGQFLLSKAGDFEIIASYNGISQTIKVHGTPRELTNTQPDIDVWLIERTPRIPFDGPNKGLPKVGDTVTWRAHVYNWGSSQLNATYKWILDGKTIKSGKTVIPPASLDYKATIIELPRKWDTKRHDLTFTITPMEKIAELISANNTLTIQTDAVTVGLWVEQSLWEYFHEYQYKVPTNDSNSFPGWGQRMMRQWNQMFKEAVWKVIPQGIVERVRLDQVIIVPDFALPLVGGTPSNNPDLRDKTVDMTWGMESEKVQPGVKLDANHWWSLDRVLNAWNAGKIKDRKEDPPFWCGLGYIHEMNHARYLVDSYGFNVHDGADKPAIEKSVQVTDEKGLITGRYMPANADVLHGSKYIGHMGGDYWSFSAFEAMCWNRVRGQRARGGNCNSPNTIGEFLQDFPEKTIYQYFDQDGNPLANAEIWIYRSTGTGKGWYDKRYEDKAGFKGFTDDQGRITLDITAWAENGKIEHTYGWSNSVALFRVTYNNQHYYQFEEVSDPNIAYNLGYKDEYTFKRQIKLRTGEPNPADWVTRDHWELPGAGFNQRP